MKIKNFPVLFKLDSCGRMRQWEIRAVSSDDIIQYDITHGLVGGALQTTSTSITEGKNLGKANETTPWEQCVSEAQSLWTKQRDREGYSETIPTEKPMLPMLAKSYKDDGKKIKWPAFTQPKLDGIRCSLSIDYRGNVTLRSRQNKEFQSLDHLKEAIHPYMDDLLGYTLDGELYNHQYKEDFQTLVSCIKRDKPSKDTHRIQYHIYDCYSDYDFKDRIKLLEQQNLFNCDLFQLVPTYEVADFDDFLSKYSEFVNDGYEGAMLRNMDGPYDINRRSPNLQKYKEFMDDEFEIVGAYQNKGKQSGQCTLICVTRDGTEFGVKPKGTEEVREQYWKDWQNGKLHKKMLSVRFFNWTTSENPVPRFPIGIAIRDYE